MTGTCVVTKVDGGVRVERQEELLGADRNRVVLTRWVMAQRIEPPVEVPS